MLAMDTLLGSAMRDQSLTIRWWHSRSAGKPLASIPRCRWMNDSSCQQQTAAVNSSRQQQKGVNNKQQHQLVSSGMPASRVAQQAGLHSPGIVNNCVELRYAMLCG